MKSQEVRHHSVDQQGALGIVKSVAEENIISDVMYCIWNVLMYYLPWHSLDLNTCASRFKIDSIIKPSIIHSHKDRMGMQDSITTPFTIIQPSPFRKKEQMFSYILDT